jgi:LPXTG-motif cell wall-anchored protein
MEIDKKDIVFIILGIAIIGSTYFVIKNKKKSFLKMTEAEKKASVEEETSKRLAIQNDSNLTQQQKIEAEEAMNKENLATRSKEEMKALAEYNLNNLMNGTTQVKDVGLPSYLSGIYT